MQAQMKVQQVGIQSAYTQVAVMNVLQIGVSAQQSMEIVKTLLSASFGCIAYLRWAHWHWIRYVSYAHKLDNVSRNLLPEENFSEGAHICCLAIVRWCICFIGRLTAGDHGCMSYDPSQKSGNGSRYVSSVAVKIVSRGFSTEADKLLNFLVCFHSWT